MKKYMHILFTLMIAAILISCVSSSDDSQLNDQEQEEEADSGTPSSLELTRYSGSSAKIVLNRLGRSSARQKTRNFERVIAFLGNTIHPREDSEI